MSEKYITSSDFAKIAKISEAKAIALFAEKKSAAPVRTDGTRYTRKTTARVIAMQNNLKVSAKVLDEWKMLVKTPTQETIEKQKAIAKERKERERKEKQKERERIAKEKAKAKQAKEKASAKSVETQASA